MRLIDADALWDAIRNDVAPFTIGMISRHIHKAPTIMELPEPPQDESNESE